MTTKCLVCEADFKAGSIKEGKCPSCTKEFPNSKNKKEAMAIHPTPNKMGDELDETKVKAIVAEMLDERFNPIVEKLDSLAKTDTTKRGPGRPKKVVEEVVD